MSSISSQIGKGYFQELQKRILNTLSGRRGITKKLLKPLKASTKQNIQKQLLANTRRRDALKKKKKLNKSEEKNLEMLEKTLPTLQTLLKAKIAPPQQQYEAQRRRLLYFRPENQKKYNKYYPEEAENTRIPQYIDNEGIVTIQPNKRNPLSKERVLLPDSELPEPPDQQAFSENVGGEMIQLAGQATVTYINAPLYYKQWKEIKPDQPPYTLEEISDEEYHEFSTALNASTNLHEFFHIPVRKSVEVWLKEMEEGLGYGRKEFKIVNFRYVFEDGRVYEKKLIMVSASVGPARLPADLGPGKIDVKKRMEIDIAQCIEPNAANNTREKSTPLTTLKTNGCIEILPSISNLEQEYAFGGMPGKNFLAIGPPYNNGIHTFIIAKYLRSMLMFNDALDDWAIVGMDYLLWQLFQTKYPEISIKMSTYIFTNFKNKVPLYLNQFKYTENFLVVDTSIEFEKNTKDFIKPTTKNPFSADSPYFAKLSEAIEEKKLYGMTPYLAYFMKRTVPYLWNKAFESKQMNYSTYQTLNEHEKIAIDYLQYLRFMDILLDNEYDFVEARNSYEDPIGDGSPTEGVMGELLALYKEDVPKHAEEISFFQSLVTRRLRPEENHAFIVEPEDIAALLQKFAGTAINFGARRNRFSALAEAVSAESPSFEPKVTFRSVVPPSRNRLTQLKSRLENLQAQRNDLQQKSVVYNEASKTRRNRKEVNQMYKNMLGKMSFFNRLTKSKNRKNLQIKRSVASATFNRLEELNRNIQQLKQEILPGGSSI